jgi:hypothetical protein
MKKNREIQNRKKRTAVYFISGLFAVLAFIVILIYPAKKDTARLNNEIKEINLRIKKQEFLQPAYTRLMITSREIEKKISELENTKFKKFLNHNDILRLPDSFKQIASQTGLKLISCSPDINSAGNGKKEFQLKLELEGDFMRFPDLLSVFEAEKKITDIQTIEITSGKEKSYFLKLWINMDK